MQICIRILKMQFIFMYDNLKCQKLHFKNKTSSPLPGFGHCTAKKKYITLKICMRVVCMYLDHIYSVFYNLKIMDFIGNYFFEKLTYVILSLKMEKYQKSGITIFRAFKFTPIFPIFDYVLLQN